MSPLKSLLREDLKRRISARASSRASRNNHNNNANGNNSENASNGTNSSNANSSTTSNSGPASTQNSSSSISFSKIGSSSNSLANTMNAISQHLLSNSSITVTTESSTTSSGAYHFNEILFNLIYSISKQKPNSTVNFVIFQEHIMELHREVHWRLWRPHRMVQLHRPVHLKRNYCWLLYRADIAANGCFNAYFVASNFQTKRSIFCIKVAIARATHGSAIYVANN